ncbi:hypothetical protein [Polyangium sp. 6x1]|uniref:hypothetical protein n=1 Tax=Polyangium sp. 6x1 TaxID=3042689 RepID=UPI002482333C|nr:hypothetical protein [Polyangium sp. 6x1]MDI1444714.1 hypothetical protein [Polyangium sp. 6x1]
MRTYGGWWLVAGVVLASACGGARARWPTGPAPVAATPQDILSCEVDTAPLVQTGRLLQACGGFWVSESCEYVTALYFGKWNEEECTREVDEVQSFHNMSLVARAMFWRDTGCGIDGVKAADDDALSWKFPVNDFRGHRVVVQGCGKEARYVCEKGEGQTKLRPQCEPAPPEVQAFAAAVVDARAVFQAQTGCKTATLVPEGAGPIPEDGVTEVFLSGCGTLMPLTCALDAAKNHAGQCAPEPPMPEAVADSQRRAEREYAEEAQCSAMGATPRMRAEPIRYDSPKGVWGQVWHAEGCRGRATLLCHASKLRSRQVNCDAVKKLDREEVRKEALEVLGKLRPDCRPEAPRVSSGELVAQVDVDATCGKEPTALRFVCDRDPTTQLLTCGLDEAHARVGVEGRAIAREQFGRAYGCASAQITVAEDKSASGYGRTIKLLGCKETATYTCDVKKDARSEVECTTKDATTKTRAGALGHLPDAL